jgi:hypothetical protein
MMQALDGTILMARKFPAAYYIRNNDSNSIVKKQRMIAATRSNRDERRIGMCFSPASANNNINFALSLSLSTYGG